MRYTNKHNLPKSLVEAITKNHYDLDVTQKNVYSITTLINSPKIHQLSLRHWDELEKDVIDEMWAFFGNMGHQVLENIEEKDRMIEQRLYHEIDGVKVTGKVDLFSPKKKQITDYKFTSAYTLVYNKGGKEEWEQQLNCYAWLYRKANFEVESIQIMAILRDWTEYQALRSKDYPQLQVQVIDIPLWSIEKQEEFIRSRIKVHQECTVMEDENTIPVCSPKERWAKDSVVAIYKNKNKTATKLCTSTSEAKRMKAYFEKENPKDTYRIEMRKGEDIKCTRYCAANKFCNYYKDTYGVKDGKKTN